MLFMHNNKYLPLTGLLTLLQWTIHNTACIVLHPGFRLEFCSGAGPCQIVIKCDDVSIRLDTIGQTDRQTDGRTDLDGRIFHNNIAFCMHCMLSRDKIVRSIISDKPRECGSYEVVTTATRLKKLRPRDFDILNVSRTKVAVAIIGGSPLQQLRLTNHSRKCCKLCSQNFATSRGVLWSRASNTPLSCSRCDDHNTVVKWKVVF